MNRKISITLIPLFIMNFCCSGMEITDINVRKELQRAAESIRNDKKNIYKLDDKIIGKKGYFYIISSNGKISHHPEKALINSDFSAYSFIRKILGDRNGCLSFNADGLTRYVFFTEIDSEQILCLTIESGEFEGTVYECNSDIEDRK
jgi:hypothetical protein